MLSINKSVPFLLKIAEIGDGVLISFIKAEGVNGGVNGVLKHIESNPGIRTDDLLVKMSCSKRTLERWIKQLRGGGKVVYKGSPRTGGYFIQD